MCSLSHIYWLKHNTFQTFLMRSIKVYLYSNSNKELIQHGNSTLYPYLTNVTDSVYDAYMKEHFPNGEVNGTDFRDCSLEKELDSAAAGTGLAFVVFTQAIVELPASPFWSIIFFLMLLALGLGSQIGTMEGVVNTVFECSYFKNIRKEVLTGIWTLTRDKNKLIIPHALKFHFHVLQESCASYLSAVDWSLSLVLGNIGYHYLMDMLAQLAWLSSLYWNSFRLCTFTDMKGWLFKQVKVSNYILEWYWFTHHVSWSLLCKGSLWISNTWLATILDGIGKYVGD